MVDLVERRREIEQIAASLVGKRITRVTYVELDYGDGLPMWDHESPRFDSLDFGVMLELSDASMVSLIWDWDFIQYNLAPIRGPIVPYGDSNSRFWPVTDRWREHLDGPIQQVDVFWDCEDPKVPESPQDFRISCARGSVTISAFESNDGLMMSTMDHVTVFFFDEDLKTNHLGPYRGLAG